VNSVQLCEQDRKTLSRLTSFLHRRLGERLVQVLLYGFKARGDGSVASDTDVRLIFRDRPAENELRELYSLRVKTPPHPRTLWVRALSPLRLTPGHT